MSDLKIEQYEKWWAGQPERVEPTFFVSQQHYEMLNKIAMEVWEEQNEGKVWDLHISHALQPKLDKDTGWWHLTMGTGKKVRVLSWDGEGNYKTVHHTNEYEKQFKSKWKRVSELVPCLIPK